MTKESLHKGTIFVDYLRNESFVQSEEGLKILNEHMLLGWLANQNLNLEPSFKLMIKNEFKRQWHLNQSYLSLLEELAPYFIDKKISPTLLKGAVLIGTIYKELGTRSMSDIDLLISKSELKPAIEILKEVGFEVPSRQKWKANKHKIELIRKIADIEQVVELHTSLFYHCEDPLWEKVDHELAPYKRLEGEHFFLFQCAHLGFQHSFLKLFWLMDIHYWLSENSELNEAKILKLAKEHRLLNSTILTIYFLQKFFGTKMGSVFKKSALNISPIKKRLFSIEFLIEPKKNMPLYLLVKHLCKDSLKESLGYNLGWLKDRLGIS